MQRTHLFSSCIQQTLLPSQSKGKILDGSSSLYRNQSENQLPFQVVWLSTFLACSVLDLEYGIAAGVICTLGAMIYRDSKYVHTYVFMNAPISKTIIRLRHLRKPGIGFVSWKPNIEREAQYQRSPFVRRPRLRYVKPTKNGNPFSERTVREQSWTLRGKPGSPFLFGKSSEKTFRCFFRLVSAHFGSRFSHRLLFLSFFLG